MDLFLKANYIAVLLYMYLLHFRKPSRVDFVFIEPYEGRGERVGRQPRGSARKRRVRWGGEAVGERKRPLLPAEERAVHIRKAVGSDVIDIGVLFFTCAW